MAETLFIVAGAVAFFFMFFVIPALNKLTAKFVQDHFPSEDRPRPKG